MEYMTRNETAEKYHYKRGFKACLVVVVIPLLTLILATIHFWVLANI